MALYTVKRVSTFKEIALDNFIFCSFSAEPRLDFQPFCEPAFLAPHHGWITGLPIVFFDQLQPSLLKSSRLPCDWSILSFVYPTWRMSVLMSFFLLQSFLQSVFQSAFTSTNLGQSQQDAVLNLLKGKDVLISQPTA